MSGEVHGWWLTCDGMSVEVHIQILSHGDTSEVGSYVPCSRLRDATCGRYMAGGCHVLDYGQVGS